MKTSSNINHYASKADYLNKKAAGKLVNKAMESAPSQLATADTVQISEEAKQAGQVAQVENSDEKKSIKDELKDKFKSKGDEAKEAGSHLLKQAGSAIKKAVSSSTIPLPTSSIPGMKGEAVEAVPKAMTLMNDRPGVFFITGFHLNPFNTDEMGLTGMSRGVPGAQVFKWNQEDDVMEQIRKIPSDRPLVLVGHGMGGDTAVNIANKLNTPDNAFRKVNLLVTLDSIGWDNDIIPQNVGKNLNYISDEDMFFNDGPNVARNKTSTEVINELRADNHNEIQENPEIQFEIFQNINDVMRLDRMRDAIDRAKLSLPQ